MAEGQGFEPWIGYKPMPVFKTGAFNRLEIISLLKLDLVTDLVTSHLALTTPNTPTKPTNPHSPTPNSTHGGAISIH